MSSSVWQVIMRFPGRNASLIKAHNQQAILMHLLHEDRMSRTELARRTTLSTATITNLTAELLQMGIICEQNGEDHSETRRVGRPRTMLRLVPDARYVIGVHIGVGLFRVAITNLQADMIANAIGTFALDAPARVVLETIAQHIQQMVATSGVAAERIMGIGVGASGLVDYEHGINVLAPRLNWSEVDIRAILQAACDWPVYVDNNVRTMAIAEAVFGCGRWASVLAFVYGRVGVGAGFVVNGEVFRGSGAGAGEIGHTVMLPQGGERCSCGKAGCLETLISENVLVEQALSLAHKSPDGLLAGCLRDDGDTRTIERIFAAARSGDKSMLAAIAKSAHYLGLALANLVNILNPDLIILGGMYAEGHDLFLPVAREVMRTASFGDLGRNVEIQPTHFGWRAGVIGAASLALLNTFYQNPEGI